jgi:GNAT superfamily N-acetyltransferase
VNAATIVIRLLEGEPAEMRELQRVVESTSGYYERVTGVPPGPAEAQSIYTVLPDGKEYEDKFVFGIYADETMVGCADLIHGYPVPDTAMLGLLLIAESHQRRGIGAQALQLLERRARQWGCARIRIGIVRSNEQARPFWVGQGFEPTGERRPYRHGSVTSEVVYLEKPLAVFGDE